ncbi:MAG TPA: bifunctional phosphopantothenoylcysteine decarboxylase/phosphopantothenate--cysteine ligase CoaBC, partial [Armatimonadota bacterium]|nr:bifunctional phosphopantothenoylcysteine decarboxylase/phosphopantothenate--cysteine ligase CoaBC [Armatimonadota bacterium]
MSAVRGRRVVVGVTGGIAAYKTCSLVSALRQAGAQVQVVMTDNARRLVSETTFATLSGRPVARDMWADRDDIAHISLADFAEVVIVAPATANIIGKMANGIADDLLSTALLAFTCPLIMAPAMNPRMLCNPAVAANIEALRRRGVMIVEPEEGRLACGDTGAGRLPDTETLIAAIEQALGVGEGPLAGKRVLVTAGPTREALDPVRFLTNPSSGKMGYALAAQAAARGAEVTLVSGPTGLAAPPGVELVAVTSAEQMNEAVGARAGEVDVFIGAAAVADWRPAEVSGRKLKKSGRDEMTVRMVPTPDIIAAVGEWEPKPLIVGFAAETEDLLANAHEKMGAKHMDMIVANDVTATDAG